MSAAGATGFVHLRVRSAYSLLEGAIKAGKIGKMAADAGMPAVAVADRANLFGALEFSQTAKDAGVQPIVACALPVRGIGGQINTRWAKTPTVVLLAQNEAGWLNLCALSSAAYLEAGEMAEPGVEWAQVAARACAPKGIIGKRATTPPPAGTAAPCAPPRHWSPAPRSPTAPRWRHRA